MKLIEKQQLIKILSTMIRLEILNKVAKQPTTISELYKQIKYPDGKPYDYKAIHKQVDFLEELGLVKLNELKDKQGKQKQGRPVVVSISPNPPLDLKDEDIKFWWNKIVLEKQHNGGGKNV